jgi:hypothetical protein
MYFVKKVQNESVEVDYHQYVFKKPLKKIGK